MFCKNCGKEIKDEKKVICPYCGKSLNSISSANNNLHNNYDAPSFGWAFLCFMIPLLGLILYCVWKDNYPQRATSAGKGALISVIISIVVAIILVCVVSCGACSVINEYNKYYR